MSFDDILEDIFDFDDESKQDEGITTEEENAGLWDTGKKENIWRAADSVANGIWDSGAGEQCEGCDTPCDDSDEDCDDSDKDCVDETPPQGPSLPTDETPSKKLSLPEDETDTVDSAQAPTESAGGLFDDLF